MPPEASSERRIGRVLVIVGTVLNGIGALFLLLAGLFALVGLRLLRGAEPEAGELFTLLAIFYIPMGLVGLVGVGVAVSALMADGAGRVKSAAIRGFVASMLPPVGVLVLVGAVLWLVSPEAKAEEAAWREGAPYAPPRP